MDRPDVLANMAGDPPGRDGAGREILGVQHRWLGFVDSGLPEGDPPPPLPEGCFALVDLEEATAPLVALIREFRPHVLVTYDENGGYPHPDHIKCHEISVAAFEAAGDPDRFPGTGDPWQPLKLYYSHGFSKARLVAVHEALLARGLESPYAEWLKNWNDDRPDPGLRVTTRVAVRGLLRGARRGAQGARHPDRPDQPLVHGAAGHPARGLADRGLRAGAVAGRRPGAGGRPVRRHPTSTWRSSRRLTGG